MRIYLSSDHGGFAYKEMIRQHLAAAGHDVRDMGNTVMDNDDDYPDFIIPMAEAVVADPGSLGIVLGRSGNGEQIAANKVPGIRAALCLSVEMAKKAREHNGAQVLSLGGDYVSEREAIAITDAFVETAFPGEGRHQRRIDKITTYEQKHTK
ncbi:ribose-5-phosphate isomerase [bacterium]|nr:ribose-5-phosphate isomerase [bacterium]